MSSRLVKRDVPWLLIVIVVGFVLGEYFFVSKAVSDVAGFLMRIGVIVVTMTMIPSAIIMGSYHSKQIRKNEETKQKILSAWFIFLMLATIVIGLGYGLGSIQFTWLYKNIGIAVSATFLSTTALYIFSALFRAFKVRSVESFFITIAALVVVLGNVPALEALTPAFQLGKSWLTDVANPTGGNVDVLVLALGSIAYATRVLLRMEPAVTGAD